MEDKSTSGKVGEVVGKGALGTIKVMADVGQQIPKLGVATVVNAADIAGDVVGSITDFATNMVTGGHGTKIQSKQGFLDNFNKWSDDKLKKQDNVKSVLDGSNKEPNQEKSEPEFKIEKTPMELDIEKKKAEAATKPATDSLTGEPAKNDGFAKKDAEEKINKANEDLKTMKGKILEKLKAGEITKQQAREILTAGKAGLAGNFDSSIADNLSMKGIDGSLENRSKLAEALGIKDYEGTYEQNIQLLDNLRYKDSDEINSLLGNK